MVAIIDYGAGNLSSVKKRLTISALKVKSHRTRKKYYRQVTLFCRVSARLVTLWSR